MKLPATFRNASIRSKLVMLMLLTAVASLLIAAPAWITYTWKSAHSRVIRDLETTTLVIAANTTAALSFGDVGAATEALSALRAKPEVFGACLYRKEAGIQRLFASYGGASVPCPLDSNASAIDSMLVVVPVVLADEKIGSLRVTQNLKPLQDVLRTQIAVTLMVLAASFALSFVLAMRMQRVITQPILQLAQVARYVSETKNYCLRVPIEGHDELSQLSSDFNNMLEQIAKADDDLQRAHKALAVEAENKSIANVELGNALESLRATQTQLVQSEKMASLGALVAGIAHEINTPIGIGVTAASTLQARAAQFKQKYDKNELTRTELERFVGIANESGDIIMNNLTRAADLIQSFKRIAVDQTNDERREFNLKHYIGEVLQSLGPTLKRAGHSITVTCSETFRLYSYPGVIAQILTNFVNNSLLHAFDAGEKGRISIEAQLDNDHVALRCSDDGKGIPAEYLSRIFDPFFTTKRGSGGTGLGLHIVYNLVTKTLGGTINAESVPGQGLAITIRFPYVATETKS